ncbi:MAG: hypothetical protein NZM28_07145 [Fimbriimonadales bacterium]|nr:hypothetical protein [Fimbriimonadales bacterium]
MTLHGTIQGRTIQLDEDPGIPDGSRVEVEVRPTQQEKLLQALRQLEAQGLLRLPPNPTAAPPLPPLRTLSGKPLSEIVMEERR